MNPTEIAEIQRELHALMARQQCIIAAQQDIATTLQTNLNMMRTLNVRLNTLLAATGLSQAHSQPEPQSQVLNQKPKATSAPIPILHKKKLRMGVSKPKSKSSRFDIPASRGLIPQAKDNEEPMQSRLDRAWSERGHLGPIL